MSPVIYWLFQNYHLTEVIIQQKLNLKENMQFEKKWMIFLMLSMMIAQSTAVVFILKKMVLSFYFPESNPHELHQMQQLPITGEPVDPVTLLGESPDAFADRRRAS